MLATIFGTHSSSKYSQSFFELIKSIGESNSKQEQDRIISSERSRLKAEVKGASRVDSQSSKEWVIRALYCEMLGSDASFAFIHGINLAQDNSNLIAKRTGYLFCGITFVPHSDANLLLINTLLKDLDSTNWLFNIAALVAICTLPSPEITNDVLPSVVRLTNHSQAAVRKRAYLAIQTIMRVTPEHLPGVVDIVAQSLSDSDAIVMSANLPLIELIVSDKTCIEWTWSNDEESSSNKIGVDFIEFFVSLLHKIAIDRELDRNYNYYHIPAPWVQARIVRILTCLGQHYPDKADTIRDVLRKILNITLSSNHKKSPNIDSAMLYSVGLGLCSLMDFECAEAIGEVVSRFLISQSPELRYAGLSLLTALTALDASYAKKHSILIVEFLEDHDEQIQKAALILIAEVTTSNNLSFVIDRLLSTIQFTYDNKYRASLATCATKLLEEHSNNNLEYIQACLKVLQTAGEDAPLMCCSSLPLLISDNSKDAQLIDGFTDLMFDFFEQNVESWVYKNSSSSDALLQLCLVSFRLLKTLRSKIFNEKIKPVVVTFFMKNRGQLSSGVDSLCCSILGNFSYENGEDDLFKVKNSVTKNTLNKVFELNKRTKSGKNYRPDKSMRPIAKWEESRVPMEIEVAIVDVGRVDDSIILPSVSESIMKVVETKHVDAENRPSASTQKWSPTAVTQTISETQKLKIEAERTRIDMAEKQRLKEAQEKQEMAKILFG